LVTSNTLFSPTTGVADGFHTVVRHDWQCASVVAGSGVSELRTLMDQPDPWLLHLHFIDPHTTYDPPAEYLEGYDLLPDIGLDLRGNGGTSRLNNLWDERPEEWRQGVLQHLDFLYRAELRSFDDELQELWANLELNGALDDSLVVFWTDHGEQFFEHGLFEHAIYLFAEENRATAAFWAKNLAPAVHTGPTQHQDVAATVAAVKGLEPLTPVSGYLVGTAPADRSRRVFNHFWLTPPRLGVIQGDRTLVYHWEGERWFFRDDTDPGQLDNIYDAADPEVAVLWEEMGAFVEQVNTTWPHLGAPTNAGP
jgi:arylsulfatase A-like enzyme